MFESLINKVAGLLTCNVFNKRFQHRCFLVNIEKFLGLAFFIEHFRWLLLFGPMLAGPLEVLGHRKNIASFSLFSK